MKNYRNFLFILIIFPIIIPSVYGENKTLEEIFSEGISAIESGDYNTALEHFDKILESEPENKSTLINKGSVLLTLEQYNFALQIYEQILQIDPQNIDALNNKGVALIGLEKYSDAIDVFNKVLDYEKNNPVAIENRRIAVDQLGRISIENSKYIVYVQIEVRNSYGSLVGFFEADRVKYLPHSMTDQYLDQIPITQIKSIDGNEYEVRHLTQQVNIQRSDFVGQTIIQDPQTTPHFTLFSTLHHGISLEKDDQFKSFWTIMRLVE